MPVVERIHHQNVDVRAHKNQVLRERMEHVPRVEVQERSGKVEAVDRDERDKNQTSNSSLAAEEAVEELFAGSKRDLVLDRLRAESAVDKVDREDQDVKLDGAEDDERGLVGLIGSFGAITECENELQYQEGNVNIANYYVEDGCDFVTEGPAMVVCFFLRRADQGHDNNRGQIV